VTVEAQLATQPEAAEGPALEDGRASTRRLRLARLRPQAVRIVPASDRRPAPPPEPEPPAGPRVRLREALLRSPARALVAALLAAPIAFGLAALLVKLKVVGSYSPELADLGGWSLLAVACVALEVVAARRFVVALGAVLVVPWAIHFSVRWTAALLDTASTEASVHVLGNAVESLLGQLGTEPVATLCAAGTTALPLAVLLAMRALRVRAPGVTQCLAPALAAVVADTAWVVAVGVDGQLFWTGWTFRQVPLGAVLVATALPHALGWTALALGLRLGDRVHDRIARRFG
jgi:hypothetical protein